MKTYRSDIAFVALVGLVVLITTNLPYYLQIRATTPGYEFGGLLFAISDQNSYLMWMRQAAEGHFLWRNLMTTEPHAPFYTNLLWLVLGQISRWGISSLVVYHVARVVFSLLLLVAVYALLGAVLSDPAQRRAALLLIATGDGLTWAFFALNLRPTEGVPVGTAAFAAPELLAWPSMALLPHFIAALAAMAGVMYFVLAAYRRPHRRVAYALAGGLLLAILAAFHVYDVVTLTAVLVMHQIVIWRSGQGERHLPRALLLVLVPGLLVTAVVEAMLLRSPMGRAWQESNLMLSYSPFAYAVGLGLPLLLALADHRRLFHFREMSPAEMLAPVWLLVNALLLFTDGLIPFERRLMMGIQIPVVVLAVRNWGDHVVPRLTASTRASASVPRLRAANLLAWGLLVALTWPGTALRLNYYATRSEYLPQDFLALCRRLEQAPPGQGVLCLPVLGNWVPQLTGQPVYAGHGELTPQFKERREEIKAFFDPTTTDRRRAELLRISRCAFVLAQGNDRTALASAVAEGLLIPEATLPTMSLYRVKLASAAASASSLLPGERVGG